MDWDKLKIFHMVSKAGSFTHAGEMLNLSQSAVSRQISSLEESLGVILFHRHARGLVLTEQGEVLYKTTSEIFDKLNSIESRLMDSRDLSDGPLVVTTSEFIGSTWLMPRIKELKEEHPEIQLSIIYDDRVFNLGLREADVAIRLVNPNTPDLIQRNIAQVNMHICASKKYLDKHGRPSKLKDLRKYTLVGYPHNCPIPFQGANYVFEMAEINIDTDYNLLMVNSLYNIYTTIKEGLGIAALPNYLIENDPDIEIILPEYDSPKTDMYFLYPQERRNSKKITIFRDFLIKNSSETSF